MGLMKTRRQNVIFDLKAERRKMGFLRENEKRKK